MAAKKKRRKAGRPPLGAGAKKSEWTGLRLQPGLRDELQASADANGRALSAEITLRLFRSLDEEKGFGHPILKEIGFMMATRFAFEGARAAGKDLPATDWIKDQHAFDEGALSVMLGLWAMRPNNSVESTFRWFEALKSRILTAWSFSGRKTK
ncbi:MAG TPA: hypothetical protein VHW69_06670 [Rhizomicrobium sp.]|jgi:hypothetical protein|nr:hypothetical protein [Rhizomicrobium sp.]